MILKLLGKWSRCESKKSEFTDSN